MNYSLILSGGVGSRLGASIPKQYIDVKGKPILIYTLEKFFSCKKIDKIIIVAANQWKENIKKWIEVFNLDKSYSIADAGDSRQESIYNGLLKCAEQGVSENDKVLIHDAVRPLVSQSLIESCIDNLDMCEGIMPGLPVTDTIYQCGDKQTITGLLNRDTLYAGQSPEGYLLKKYLKVNALCTKQQLSEARGSSELAVKGGISVKLICGELNNFKITTLADLEKFKGEIEKNR